MSDRTTETFWSALRAETPARVGLHRVGDGVGTRHVLEAAEAHAFARDAVHGHLDVPALAAELDSLGLGPALHVPSKALDRATYLTRPDLGRMPGELPPLRADRADLCVVLADGLSAEAVHRHAVPVLRELLPLLDAGTTVAPPVVATQARVALGDHVGAVLRAALVLVLVGERPGLSSSDSLGAYLTWAPAPGVQDSARNCVSNIRPPHGLDHASAARTLARLIGGARRLGATGVRLKDTGELTAPPEPR
ncbi:MULTISPECIES: ethanolamine ammonia-lyase subunit EutC [Nocardioides]|uniref:Ethanolamine ammonia-lyase small subunit n=1 Tax=Nocardioides vastitatis TaxID=2568655 RepID=A0ABW0ZFE0_9ACTN|nr:ethanolamine ammonia-lyase subunit EutC [Nocardioides sp.]